MVSFLTQSDQITCFIPVEILVLEESILECLSSPPWGRNGKVVLQRVLALVKVYINGATSRSLNHVNNNHILVDLDVLKLSRVESHDHSVKAWVNKDKFVDYEGVACVPIDKGGISINLICYLPGLNTDPLNRPLNTDLVKPVSILSVLVPERKIKLNILRNWILILKIDHDISWRPYPSDIKFLLIISQIVLHSIHRLYLKDKLAFLKVIDADLPALKIRDLKLSLVLLYTRAIVLLGAEPLIAHDILVLISVNIIYDHSRGSVNEKR